MTGGDALVRLERAGNLIFDIPDDLETVVDSVALERFVMLGMLGGAAVSIAYAAQHPNRVSKLVIYGGYAQGHNQRGSGARS